MYGAKLNISCTGLMDCSPNYGMKPMKRVERNDKLLIMLICLIVSSSFMVCVIARNSVKVCKRSLAFANRFNLVWNYVGKMLAISRNEKS